jgi:hypothetical protein
MKAGYTNFSGLPHASPISVISSVSFFFLFPPSKYAPIFVCHIGCWQFVIGWQLMGFQFNFVFFFLRERMLRLKWVYIVHGI